MSSNMEEGKMKKWGVGRGLTKRKGAWKREKWFLWVKVKKFFKNQCKFSLQQKLEG